VEALLHLSAHDTSFALISRAKIKRFTLSEPWRITDVWSVLPPADCHLQFQHMLCSL
jgi:predicted dithiol-disulfide oxidoreductase (DUF899 family)